MLSLSFALDAPTKVAILGSLAPSQWTARLHAGQALAGKAVDRATTAVTAPLGRQFSRDTGMRARALEAAGVPSGMPADLLSGVSLRKGLGYGSLLGAGIEGLTGRTTDKDGNDIPLYERLGTGALHGALAGGIGAGLVRGHVDRLAKPHMNTMRAHYGKAVTEAKNQGLTGPVRLNKITPGASGTQQDANVEFSPIHPQATAIPGSQATYALAP